MAGLHTLAQPQELMSTEVLEPVGVVRADRTDGLQTSSTSPHLVGFVATLGFVMVAALHVASLEHTVGCLEVGDAQVSALA
jgi:hypothetical protein